MAEETPHETDHGIGPATTIRFTLDQVVRIVVVVVVFCIGWLWRAQEALRGDQKLIWDRIEANAAERQDIKTKIAVMDEVGKEKISNLTRIVEKATASVEKLADELVNERRARP